jgi:hypothetical protein
LRKKVGKKARVRAKQYGGGVSSLGAPQAVGEEDLEGVEDVDEAGGDLDDGEPAAGDLEPEADAEPGDDAEATAADEAADETDGEEDRATAS